VAPRLATVRSTAGLLVGRACREADKHPRLLAVARGGGRDDGGQRITLNGRVQVGGNLLDPFAWQIGGLWLLFQVEEARWGGVATAVPSRCRHAVAPATTDRCLLILLAARRLQQCGHK
jgi:hypothetical protein